MAPFNAIVICLFCFASVINKSSTLEENNFLKLIYDLLFNPFNDVKNADRNIQGKTISKVKINVYYETLCPGSMEFIVDKLAPTVEYLGSFLDVNLIPYGHVKKSTENGRDSFECQHGPEECYRNTVHACAVDSIRNSSKAVLFNACLMSPLYYGEDVDFDTTLIACGSKYEVDTQEIKKCVNGSRGDNLFKRYGEMTHDFYYREVDGVRVSQYVPYAVFDMDGMDKMMDRRANFMWDICDILNQRPKVCSQPAIFKEQK